MSGENFEPEIDSTDGVEINDDHAVERSVVTDELERHEGQTRPDSEPVKDEPAEKEPADKSADEKDDDEDEKAEKGERKGRFLEDGRYEVTKADGTTVILDRDELPPAGVSRRKWYQTLSKQVEESQQALQEQQERHARELAEIKAQIAETRHAEDVKDKPWLAKEAPRPSVEDFDSVDEWADARDEWKAAQEAHAKPEQQPAADDAQRAAQAKLARDAAAMLEEGTERFEDFEDVVKNNPSAPFDTLMTSFLIAEAEDAPAAFHYLGSHVDEAKQIRVLLDQGNVRGAIRALAKAEARTSGTSADKAPDSGFDTEARPPARASSAPAPIRPVNGAAPPRRNPDAEPVSSYIERRRKEELGIR